MNAILRKSAQCEGEHGWLPSGYSNIAPEINITKEMVDAGVRELTLTHGHPYSVRVASIFAAMLGKSVRPLFTYEDKAQPPKVDLTEKDLASFEDLMSDMSPAEREIFLRGVRAGHERAVSQSI